MSTDASDRRLTLLWAAWICMGLWLFISVLFQFGGELTPGITFVGLVILATFGFIAAILAGLFLLRIARDIRLIFYGATTMATGIGLNIWFLRLLE